MPTQENPWKSDEELVDVEVISISGDRYEFPNVIWKTLWPIIRSETLHDMPSLSFVNASRACLIMPTVNVQNILINGQIYWTRPSTH